ncbi:flagellar basal-body rod protein FlgF [Natroniella sulfidigena]|uniref:flagellar basal-body rod protein FlgF n=1 Tax=Natroniella sulfidigena TaxID=723921 RepID=UPI00200A474B|nr:flagellar basal-body rod protein FlgF [Natroniella sulfidigena]MCK8816384.1 flagellar basal-body rod protein FlgF [Natroniella sulfidigena]
MIRGLYTSASGMAANLEQNDTISNNLSNLNTSGYKKQLATKHEFPSYLLHRTDQQVTPTGKIGSGVMVDEIKTDHGNGSFKKTGNDFDWAVQGEGFFTIQTPQGERYTRSGEFTLNDQGEVVTQDGHPVLGENGILQVPFEGEISIDNNNNLLVDEMVIDSIRVTGFEDKNGLTREGSNLFAAGPEVDNVFLATGGVVQGYLEESNVNAIEEMTRMINNTRNYEANQKGIQAHDDTMGKAVNEVGRT